MTELVYEELSYKLIGIAYKIDNQLGFGHQEQIYSKAFTKLLEQESIKFEKEVYCSLKIDDKVISKRFIDLLIDDKIVVELKVGNYRYKEVFKQILEYLKIHNLQLGLIIRFAKTGVEIKRVLNIMS